MNVYNRSKIIYKPPVAAVKVIIHVFGFNRKPCFFTCRILRQHENMIYSSPPSAAYMRRWTGSALVQKMACRIFCAEPLAEPMLTLRNKLHWHFHRNTKFFIHENASENIVCEMAASLSRWKWVKSSTISWFWDSAEINPKAWNTRNCLSCIPRTMTTATQDPDSI